MESIRTFSELIQSASSCEMSSIEDTLDKTRIKAIVSEDLASLSYVKLDELAENQSILMRFAKIFPFHY